MAEPITRGEVLLPYISENQGSFARQRDVLKLMAEHKNTFAPVDDAHRTRIKDFYNDMMGFIPPSEEEIPKKFEEATKLTMELAQDVSGAYMLKDISGGMDDLKAGNLNTPAAKEVLAFGRALIGMQFQAIQEAKEWLGKGGPKTQEASRELDLREYREKYEEPVRWVDRAGERNLMKKISNVLLTTGSDGRDVGFLLTLVKSKASLYGHLGDYAKAIAHLVGDEHQAGPMKTIMEIGSPSNVNMEKLSGMISSLTSADVVAFANLTWSFNIGGEHRSLSVGQVLEKLLTLGNGTRDNGRRVFTDKAWTNIRDSANPYIDWMKSGDLDNPFRGAAGGMELDPGFLVYKDTVARKAGVMDGGTTYVEDIPANVRDEKIWQALIDGSPAITLLTAARALAILTQPIQRLYGGSGIMEALPAIQKIYGPLYEKYYTNQAPFFRFRGHVNLLSMADRAVRSPLETIYPFSSKNLTMDSVAFMEIRDQGVARGGIEINEDSVRAELLSERPGLQGEDLRFALNERLNKIDVTLLHIFGCPVDDPGSFKQEYAVAGIVGAMNDVLITSTCEERENPIQDPAERREAALSMARRHFKYQVDLAFSHTDKRLRSVEPLTRYVKFVHAPPEMIKHRLELMPDEYKKMLDHVNFAGLLKRWKGIPENDADDHFGVDAAIQTVESMGAGVMATLPGGSADLNSPFMDKQGGYWGLENKLYSEFVKGYPLALQVLDDKAQTEAGLTLGGANQIEEDLHLAAKSLISAMKGVRANEKIRGGAVDELMKWVQETAPALTFIGGKPPVVTFFHIAATVAASISGKEFVPPYIDKARTAYIVDGGARKHAPLGVNDNPAEWGDFYDNLPEDILALVGVEKEAYGGALLSPGRITPLPAIGLEERDHTIVDVDGAKGRKIRVYRQSKRTHNPSEYAGSMKLMLKNADHGYAVLLQTIFDQLCDVGLLDKAEKGSVMRGLDVLPELGWFKKHFHLE